MRLKLLALQVMCHFQDRGRRITVRSSIRARQLEIHPLQERKVFYVYSYIYSYLIKYEFKEITKYYKKK